MYPDVTIATPDQNLTRYELIEKSYLSVSLLISSQFHLTFVVSFSLLNHVQGGLSSQS